MWGLLDRRAPVLQVVELMQTRDELDVAVAKKQDLGELTQAHEALTENMFQMRRQSLQLEKDAHASHQLRKEQEVLVKDTSQAQEALQQLWAQKQESAAKIGLMQKQIAGLQQALDKALERKRAAPPPAPATVSIFSFHHAHVSQHRTRSNTLCRP